MVMHTTAIAPANAIGQLATCGLLMSNGMQDKQIVHITFNRGGRHRGACEIANGMSEMRGYIGSPKLGEMNLWDSIGK